MAMIFSNRGNQRVRETVRRAMTMMRAGLMMLCGPVIVGAAEEISPPDRHDVAHTPEKMAEARAQHEARRATWLASVRLELRAVGEVGGVPVALIDIDGQPGLVKEGMSIVGRDMVSIDVPGGRMTVRFRDNRTESLPLVDPRPVNWPTINERTIESMLSPEAQRNRVEEDRHGRIPHEVLAVWTKINRDAREEILLNYLRRGLVICYLAEDSSGVTGRLLEKRISERSRELREVFLASLTPGQRAEYNLASPAIRFTAPPAERDKQASRAREIQANRERVIAELTPEQRKLYDAWQGTPAPAPPR